MLPRLKETNKTRDMLQDFKGINKNVRASDGEFFAMKNTTSAYYPALSPRNPRGVAMKLEDCGGLLAKDKLCYIEGDTLHYGDETLPLLANLNKERQLVSFGAYIIVFPDQIYLNTADLSDRGQIIDHAVYTYPTGENTVDIELVDAEGKSIPIMYINGCKWRGKVKTVAVSQYDKSGGNPYSLNATTYLGDEWTNVAKTESSYNTFGSAIADYIEAQKLKYGGADGDEYVFFGMSSVNHSFPPQAGETVTPEDPHKFGIRHVKRSNYTGGVKDGIVQGVENVKWKRYSEGFIYVEPIKESTEVNEFTLMDYYTTGSKTYYIEVKGVNCPKVDEYLLDCTETPAKVKRYTEDGWKDVETFVKITTTGIGTNVSGDNVGIKLVGFDSLENVYYQSGLFEGLMKKYSTAYGRLGTVTDDYVLAPGTLSTGYTKVSGVSGITLDLQKLNLNFDYVIESQNRLWACRYGTDLTGEKVNKIYASALGDFRKWDKFDGTDDDSYFVNVGSDGEFTGAVNYNGNPIFFKENCIHRIYGTYPSAYQLSTETSFGLQKNSEKSLQVIGGSLFYKTPDGIYTYNGGSNTCISLKLGLDRHSKAIAGSLNNKYYVSMVSEEEGKRLLYVYDIFKDMWHIEDDIDVVCMERFEDNLYIATKDGTVFTVKDNTGKSDEIVEWSAETGIIGYTSPDSKYISCVQIRMNLDFGAEVEMYIEYDSSEDWEFKGAVKGGNVLSSYPFPIQPRRCDHFKIRLKGKGKCKIFSFTKVLEQGGIV